MKGRKPASAAIAVADVRTESRHTALPPGSSIPGGKALARYVAGIVVAHQRHHWEAIRQVHEQNLKLAQVTSGALHAYIRMCVMCGKLSKEGEKYEPCSGGCGRLQCAACHVSIACDKCAVKCHFPDCKQRMILTNKDRKPVPGAERRSCIVCKTKCCSFHSQYCPGCGDTLCWHAQDKITCVSKHDCTQRRQKLAAATGTPSPQ